MKSYDFGCEREVSDILFVFLNLFKLEHFLLPFKPLHIFIINRFVIDTIVLGTDSVFDIGAECTLWSLFLLFASSGFVLEKSSSFLERFLLHKNKYTSSYSLSKTLLTLCVTLEKGDRVLNCLRGVLEEFLSLKSMVLDYLDFWDCYTLKFFIISKISLKLESAAVNRMKYLRHDGVWTWMKVNRPKNRKINVINK